MVETRDVLLVALGLGIGFFIFSAVGREAVKTGVGVTKAEAERLLRKVQKRSKERAKI